MKRCALLTMDDMEGFYSYDKLIIPELELLNWNVSEVSWHANVDWSEYELVVVRSTWDYQQHTEKFLNVLNNITLSGATLANSLDLIRWNINKSYLKSLNLQGIPIVPTTWHSNFCFKSILSMFNEMDCSEIIIKPVVSANADDTYLLNAESLRNNLSMLGKCFNNREFMIQPFIKSVVEEGEFSLFYFNGNYSHCILKTPKKNDFRVQEEHGGSLMSIQPNSLLKNLSLKVLSLLPEQPLYSRLDFVREGQSFYLMEIELIEPSLYFNMDKSSATSFAKSVDEWYSQRKICS